MQYNATASGCSKHYWFSEYNFLPQIRRLRHCRCYIHIATYKANCNRQFTLKNLSDDCCVMFREVTSASASTATNGPFVNHNLTDHCYCPPFSLNVQDQPSHKSCILFSSWEERQILLWCIHRRCPASASVGRWLMVDKSYIGFQIDVWLDDNTSRRTNFIFEKFSKWVFSRGLARTRYDFLFVVGLLIMQQ